ncbi:hypothetical protein L1887_20073 [Cichorium endivia]|nr:hypothetical protein L1887_20073 [Cichorium endivia]
MKKSSFSKFANDQSDPIILDFDSDFSQPRVASHLPGIPKKTELYPNGGQYHYQVAHIYINTSLRFLVSQKFLELFTFDPPSG